MNENDAKGKEEAGAPETGAAGHAQNARNGKIASLPLAIRTSLNQRLRNGEKGPVLLDWLNGLPEVKQAMKDHFAGAALSLENLSRWRKGGYQDWLAEERARESVAAITHQAAALDGFCLQSFTQKMALVIVTRLAMELHRIESLKDDETRFKSLRDIMWGFIFLRRSETETERLKREQERKAGYRLPQEELEKQFWLWASDPEHKESVRRRLFMSEEEKKAARDHILSDDGAYWAADEAYIEAHGGKLGATLPEELMREIAAMKAKLLEEPAKEACPAKLPEQPPPWAATR